MKIHILYIGRPTSLDLYQGGSGSYTGPRQKLAVGLSPHVHTLFEENSFPLEENSFLYDKTRPLTVVEVPDGVNVFWWRALQCRRDPVERRPFTPTLHFWSCKTGLSPLRLPVTKEVSRDGLTTCATVRTLDRLQKETGQDEGSEKKCSNNQGLFVYHKV